MSKFKKGDWVIVLSPWHSGFGKEGRVRGYSPKGEVLVHVDYETLAVPPWVILKKTSEITRDELHSIVDELTKRKLRSSLVESIAYLSRSKFRKSFPNMPEEQILDFTYPMIHDTLDYLVDRGTIQGLEDWYESV